MNRYDAFEAYNPAVIMMFFAGAIILGIIMISPIYLMCGFAAAAGYLLVLKGRSAIKLIFGLIPVVIFVAIINPLLNSRGEEILFRWIGGRPFTMESLIYGFELGLMFATVILWFASYSIIMTSDKFMYMVGGILPATSLVLTMVLRLVPEFVAKTKEIGGGRKAIGKGAGRLNNDKAKGEGGHRFLKDWRESAIYEASVILSSLTTWALEGGIIAGDSMRSRGYGSCRPSHFAIYRISSRDVGLIIIMAVLICLFLIGYGRVISGHFVAILSYGCFMALPIIINIKEEITWRILRSRI